MPCILILGAGKIGSLIGTFLAETKEYTVHLADIETPANQQKGPQSQSAPIAHAVLDASNAEALERYVNEHQPDAVISSLPYYCNPTVAEVARKSGLHYFDLTEDVEVTERIEEISRGSEKAFVPQCGLAPGFISIAANELMQHFDTLDIVKMRVGALPINPSNALKYSLTWSTDGLINEYGNLCYGIENGMKATLMPLEGYETIEVDGLLYEAFNTSGGLGTLADTYSGKVQTMNYKTLRYPGHCEKIHFLMNDLKLNTHRELLKYILENAIPKTYQDVVLIYVSVVGRKAGELIEENYVKKIYPQTIAGKLWSAIQVTTAAGMCSVVDSVFADPQHYQGFIKQEAFALPDILSNRFGRYYA
ncbi:MAG: saccharopine dehydrogenase NADP-binding domain-containing protein [Nitrospirae bacterium]|nr:saccharopine dehydrogenase NADP-binding domain-containing protein [Nitrospirota bacterium]MDA1304694.1 saccharopine dehydrogenase NADP-binding domain-containing protein [Nitrospirota bacterium]